MAHFISEKTIIYEAAYNKRFHLLVNLILDRLFW